LRAGAAAAFASKETTSRWGAGAVRAAWHCLVPASKQRVVFV